MPTAAPKPCSVCSTLVRDGTSRCQQHKPAPWLPSRNAIKRTRGRILQRQRNTLFSREPLCRICIERGHVTVATIRDHIKPLAEGGADDDDNVQPLCQQCSDTKTAQESARGRGGKNPHSI